MDLLTCGLAWPRRAHHPKGERRTRDESGLGVAFSRSVCPGHEEPGLASWRNAG